MQTETATSLSIVERYRAKPSAGGHGNPAYAAMVQAVDDSVGRILRRKHAWQRGHEERYDLTARARLWRHLTGDDRFDVDYYLTRLEHRASLLGSAEAR